MTARRFAQDTSVPVSKTQEELKARLRKAGADQIMVLESDERSALGFRLGAGMYRITVPTDSRAHNVAQDQRRAWRLLGLVMKSKLEAIREGATTIEREFLADRLLHDGRTVGEWAQPQIDQAQAEGRLPNQLLLEGPK